mgnify:CR=1 FL=1
MPTSCNERPHRIGYAVKQCREGKAVTRRGWKVKGQRVTLTDYNGEGYLMLTTASGRSWPVTLGHKDILASDWTLAHAA